MKKNRDFRIDLLKGIALAMVLINHIGYVIPNSYWTFLTNKYYGFSDAAELFLFMSGYLFGKVYLKNYERNGFKHTLRKAIHRNFQLYLWIVFVSILVFGTYSLFSMLLKEDFIVSNMTVEKFFNETYKVVPRMLVLGFSVTYTNILRFYISVIILGVLFIPILRKNYMWLMIISVLLYIASFWIQLTTYYDLFSWQLLFIIAMIIGSKIQYVKSRRYFYFAMSYLLGSFILSIYINLIIENPSDLPGFIQYLVQKYPISIFRILHCLALFYVFNYFVHQESKWRHNSFVSFFVEMGKNSLEVYSFGVFFAHLSHVFLIYANRSFLVYTMEVILGIILSIVFAYIMSWYKTKPWIFKQQITDN